MTEMQERRNQDARRVSVETLVEVCGGMRGFEAESVNISRTGMQVRTAYLPEEGVPLVCRFHDRGREVVAEGVVAWRREGTRGGEFGVRFTALDSRGAEALRELCGELDVSDDAGENPDDDAVTESQEARAKAVGTAVRLHIAGLGAPMKARVRDSGRKSVRVASKLEFLKVGRELELEDIEQGERRTAVIDGVDVSLDPSTQIPQLVVALRFGDQDTTPDPSVVDTARGRGSAAGEGPRKHPHEHAGPRIRESRGSRPEQSREAGRASTRESWENDGDAEAEAQAVKGRLTAFAQGAGAATERAGKNMAALSARAATSLATMLSGARTKLKSRAPAEESPRRQTAPAPAGPLKVDGKRVTSLRPQSSSRDAEGSKTTAPAGKPERASSKRLTRAVIAAGALAGLSALGVSLWGGSDAPPGEATEAGARPSAVNVVAKEGAAPDVTKVEAAPTDPVEAPPATVASVPLFGATPMATMEPAPLGAPPALDDQSASEEARERALAALTRVEDELWPKDKEEGKGGASDKEKKAESASASPTDVAPWGRGRMHLPTIHRLRLDAPGEAIMGAMTAQGFSVVVPKRKIVEDGQTIKSRDNRIAKVRTRNIAAGGEVTFQFRSDVPPYRVRLRKDFLEVLISAPADKKM